MKKEENNKNAVVKHVARTGREAACWLKFSVFACDLTGS